MSVSFGLGKGKRGVDRIAEFLCVEEFSGKYLLCSRLLKAECPGPGAVSDFTLHVGFLGISFQHLEAEKREFV